MLDVGAEHSERQRYRAAAHTCCSDWWMRTKRAKGNYLVRVITHKCIEMSNFLHSSICKENNDLQIYSYNQSITLVSNHQAALYLEGTITQGFHLRILEITYDRRHSVSVEIQELVCDKKCLFICFSSFLARIIEMANHCDDRYSELLLQSIVLEIKKE